MAGVDPRRTPTHQVVQHECYMSRCSICTTSTGPDNWATFCPCHSRVAQLSTSLFERNPCALQAVKLQHVQAQAAVEDSTQALKESLFASDQKVRAALREIDDLRAQQDMVVAELARGQEMPEKEAPPSAVALAAGLRSQCQRATNAVARSQRVCCCRLSRICVSLRLLGSQTNSGKPLALMQEAREAAQERRDLLQKMAQVEDIFLSSQSRLSQIACVLELDLGLPQNVLNNLSATDVLAYETCIGQVRSHVLSHAIVVFPKCSRLRSLHACLRSMFCSRADCMQVRESLARLKAPANEPVQQVSGGVNEQVHILLSSS